ncbi:MAG: hypothetical protein KF809_15540 [Chloroflexi bacterium]|nr:hypothetical protein [Chloroflexota bacterium]
MGQAVIGRRTFLGATAGALAGVAGAQRVLGRTTRPPAATDVLPTQVAADPIADQARALFLDQDAIFRFVADEVAYEPYAGALRGPRVTLAGRAGNAADKALLLAALLDAALVRTRFVVGTLDDAAAASLTGTTVDPEAARARAQAVAAAAVPDAASEQPSPEIQAMIDRLPEIDAAVTAWAAATTDASVRTIVDALAGAGIQLPTGAAALPEQERTHHVWVQAEVGADWVDLDATLVGATPGTTIATATGEPLDTLPDDLRHRIDIAIVGERIAGDGLEQETLIEHTLFADELSGVPLSIGHAKPEGLQGLGLSLEQLVTGGVSYVPWLQVDQTSIIAETGLLLGTGEGLFDTGPGDRDGEATAEWLDVTIAAPGGRVTTTRRALLDRIGAAARLAGPIDPTTIPSVELVDLSPDERQEYPPLRSLHSLTIATGATAQPSMAGMRTDGERAITALGLPGPRYHLARDSINATVSLDRGVAIHLDAPNVVLRSDLLAVQPDGTLSASAVLDLLHRSFGTLPTSTSSAAVPAGVLAGVTSHVAERLRGGEGLPTDLAFAPPTISAGAILDRAAVEGIGLRVIQGSLPTDLAVPAEAVGALTEALAAGWVAIGPERPVTIDDSPRLGWWLVDPATGATVDLLDDGRGAVLAENVALMMWGFNIMAFFTLLGVCLASTFFAIQRFMAASPGASALDIPIGAFACPA